MAAIRLYPEAALAMLKESQAYATEHRLTPLEMGAALILAGVSVCSRLNNVQLDELYVHVKNLSATLRKPNAS